MYCKNCGAPLAAEDKFCQRCGTIRGTDGRRAGKKRWGLLIAAGVLAVAVVIAAIWLIGLLTSDKSVIAQAIMKSSEAYSEAAEDLGLSVLDELDARYSSDLRYEVKNLDYALELHQDVDTQKNMSDMSFGVECYGKELLDIQLFVREGMLYAQIPEIFRDVCYSAQMEQLDEVLSQWGIDASIVEAFAEEPALSAQARARREEAAWALVSAMTTRELEEQVITVNGYSLACTPYEVVITQQALEDFIAVLEETAADIDTADQIMLVTGEDPGSDEAELYAQLKESVRKLGDVTLTVYLRDGYLMCVVYEDVVDESDIRVSLELGGGSCYVDDLSLAVQVDDVNVCVDSTGDHSGRSGHFYDMTTVTVRKDDEQFEIISDLQYDRAMPGDNLQWQIGGEEGQLLKISGRVQTTDRFHADLTMRIADMEEALDLKLVYSLYDYTPRMTMAQEQVDLLDMTPEQKAQLEEKVTQWLERMTLELAIAAFG